MKIRKLFLTIAITLFALNIYSQVDSLENRIIYAWTLNAFDYSPELIQIDTSLASFQNYNPLLVNTITGNYLGNLGSASQSKIYYDRSAFNTGFLFSEPYGIYFHLPQNQVYYNTKRQYTLLKYSTAGPRNESEQLLKVLHTQNVNEKFNVGFNYDLLTSDGRYLNQQVRQNKITLFSAYRGSNYNIHANINLNRIKAQENGGIDSLQYIFSNDYSNRKNVPVRLDGASNEVLNTNLYLVQEYRFGRKSEEIVIAGDNSLDNNKDLINREKRIAGTKNARTNEIRDRLKKEDSDSTVLSFESDSIKQTKLDTIINPNTTVKRKVVVSGFSISHKLIYNIDVRKYKDDLLTDTFYNKLDTFYINKDKAYDEVQQKQFANELSLNYKFKDKFSACLAFYNEQMAYTYNIPPDSLFINNDTIVNTELEQNYSNSNVSAYLKAKLFDLIYFSGYAEYYINGYKKENSKLKGKFAYLLFKNTELSLEGNYQNHRPDYFYENYSSNFYQWNNQSLRDIEEWDIGFAIRNSKYKLDSKISYGQITNHIFLDTLANVAQYNGQINILRGEISKRLKLGPVNSVTRFVYQKSTNDSILSIPEYNLYQSIYFEHLTRFSSTRGELLWQVGLDYRYSSKYMADAYMPTSGLFYKQYNQEQSNYHCFDVFVNFGIKRARLYFDYNYLNVMINKNYQFTGPYYPAPDPVFKFGVAWTFYD